MIVSKDVIRKVLRGGPVELAGDRLEIGTVHALQTRVGKKASCTVKILEQRDEVYLVQLATRPVAPLYLARVGGYTEDPSYAVQDEVGVAEWSPPRDYVDRGYADRDNYRRGLRSDALERRLPEVDSWDELVRLKMLAREFGIDIRSDLRTIERRLDAIADKIRAGRQAA